MFINGEHMKLVNSQDVKHIVEACRSHLEERLGVKVTPVAEDLHRTDKPWSIRRDFDLMIRTRPPFRLNVELKVHRRLTPEQIRMMILTRPPGPRILFAPWISDEQGEVLRQAGLYYADTLGNIYLRREKPSLLIHVQGRPPKETPRSDAGRIIEPSGLKVLHALLNRPEDLLKTSYRRIAARTGVSLGTLSVVLGELRRNGFLQRIGTPETRLVRRRELLELFVRGYSLKLRSDLRPVRYRHETGDPVKILDGFVERLKAARAQGEYAVTGGFAARELTGHLEPDAVTLHLGPNAREVLRGERMLPDPDGGNVTILERFTGCDDDPDVKPGPFSLATPLLVYAELLRDGRPRELEAAGMIHERHLARRLEG